MPPWMNIEGKLELISILFRASALFAVLTNTMTWLKSNASSKSINLRVFFSSSSLTKNCCRPWRVSFMSWSIKISKGFFMNFLQMALTSEPIVAENIITYFIWGVILKIDWTSCLISTSLSILSHSSRINYFKFSIFKCPPFPNASILPGVPTIIAGGDFSKIFIWSLIG